MKLAAITPDGQCQCYVCSWHWKAPSKRRKGGELNSQEKFRYLEQSIISHLKNAHDRLLFTREVLPLEEEGKVQQAYYFGNRPGRVKWQKINVR